MSKLNISRLTNENEDGSPYISGISTFSSTAFLVPPSGTTAQRPEFVKPGMIRFNTDGAHLEYYNGVEWTEVLVANNSLDGGNRGLFGGGVAPTTATNIISYVTISTLGNSIDFGDLTLDRYGLSACSSSTRGIFSGGSGPAGAAAVVNRIDYITIASTGNATTFGGLTSTRRNLASCSSNTRGLFAGSYAPYTADINYITIASEGNGVSFGSLSSSRGIFAACASSTRGVFGGGYSPSPVQNVNIIEYVTISTLGNAVDFGDLTRKTSAWGALSNSTRGVWGGGYTNAMEFITIASTGNATDFGTLTANRGFTMGASSSTRGLFAGGREPASPNAALNTIDYITILTTGNAVDFGALYTPTFSHSGLSNGHGGL